MSIAYATSSRARVEKVHQYMSRSQPGAGALAWAKLPAGDVNWWAFRLSIVRGFAAYLHAPDPAHEVPPKDLLPRRSLRATPYLYSDQELHALMAATSSMPRDGSRDRIHRSAGLEQTSPTETQALRRAELILRRGRAIVPSVPSASLQVASVHASARNAARVPGVTNASSPDPCDLPSPNPIRQKPRLSGAFFQSGRQDLNLRPPGPQPELAGFDWL
ncbi:MAG TPA: hypothetical protein VG365_08050 [Solirubrobacteraceae bacterium]|nr:hypothetical protein [Solirubrobacteraceae bacterium]